MASGLLPNNYDVSGFGFPSTEGLDLPNLSVPSINDLSGYAKNFWKSGEVAGDIGAPPPRKPEQSGLIPATPAQAAATQPAQNQPEGQPQFVSRPQTLDPNTVIARRPGGMITVPTATVVRSQQPTAGEVAANADVTEQQARLVGAQQELMDQQAGWVAKKAETQQKLVDIEQASQARQAEIEKEKNAVMQDGVTKLNALTEDVRGREIKDYWADKSTFSKVIAAVGIAIGGGLQGMRGGPNPALQILNQAIEADLVKQKENINKGFGDLAEQKSLLAETSKLYDNKLIAEEAARTTAYRSVANELDVMASKAQSDEMKSSILQMSEAVKLQAAQSEQSFQQSLRSDVTQQFATKIIPAKTITVGDVIGEQAKRQGYVDYNDMVKEKKMNLFVPEYGGFAYDSKDARDLREMGAKRGTLRSLLQKLIRFRSEHKQFDALNPGEKAKAQALVTEAALIKKDVNQLGVLAGPDMELLESGLPDPNSIFSFSADRYQAVLDSVKIAERQDIKNRVQPAVNIPRRLRREVEASSFKSGI